MKPRGTLRRWPTRNFLEELEAPDRDRYALDELARREPRIRRAQRLLRSASRRIQSRVSGPDWVRYLDAALSFHLAVFEVAFNLGYENGVIGRAGGGAKDRSTRAQPPEARLSLDLRRALARATVGPKSAARVLLEIALTLVGSGDSR